MHIYEHFALHDLLTLAVCPVCISLMDSISCKKKKKEASLMKGESYTSLVSFLAQSPKLGVTDTVKVMYRL